MKQIVLIHPGIFETRFHFQRLIKMLEREGFEVELHKCWAKNTKLKSDFDISHSGGYICPHYKAAKTKKRVEADAAAKKAAEDKAVQDATSRPSLQSLVTVGASTSQMQITTEPNAPSITGKCRNNI